MNNEYKGKCGPYLTWKIDGATLTISGTGDMDWYATDQRDDLGNPPWDNELIENIIIEYGVTSIGKAAFAGQYKLNNVRIAESVTRIGACAFRACVALENVILPDRLTYIDSEAFSRCTSLKSILIPDNVQEIGSWAFSYCTSLAEVRCPTTACLKPRVFEDTPWIKKQAPFGIRGNSLYQYNGNATEVIVPYGIEEIGERAFNRNLEITKVVIPEGVRNICPFAFNSCISLREVVLPHSLKTISTFAFCGCSNLKKVVIPEGTKRIERTAFYQSGIEELYIPRSITLIEFGAYLCGYLRDVYYAGSKDEWSRIRIEKQNTALLKATMHFNCTEGCQG